MVQRQRSAAVSGVTADEGLEALAESLKPY
jgi:hypothetical protein